MAVPQALLDIPSFLSEPLVLEKTSRRFAAPIKREEKAIGKPHGKGLLL
jgi:hypothetical protein